VDVAIGFLEITYGFFASGQFDIILPGPRWADRALNSCHVWGEMILLCVAAQEAGVYEGRVLRIQAV